MLWDVVVPSAMPELLNGIRTALALSFILLVSSELIVAREGLGYLIGFARRQRLLRRDVCRGADRGVPRLRRRPRLPDVMRPDAAMARHDAVAPRQTPAIAAPALAGGVTLLSGIARVFSIVVLLIAWEMLARSGAVTPFMLPSLVLGARADLDRRGHRRLFINTGADALPRAGRLR